MSEVGQPLPKWQSHKKVWGDKIIAVAGGSRWGNFMDGHTVETETWKLEGGGVIQPNAKLIARVPEEMDPTGGYYVRYEDGFESWSPAKAFEEGYTRV